jgi:hypothetical protein
MNGVSSTLKEELKKSQDSKKKEKFKFIAAVLATNLVVALLCSPSQGSKNEKTTLSKTLHPHHQMMVLPLEALVSESAKDEQETLVTVISKDKKIIVQKAYLHEELQKKDDSPRFKIEIPDGEVVHVSDFISAGMLAVPYVENKKSKSIKQGSKYEVSI